MCGIVAAIAERSVVPILLEGLKRLEYRGYDSAGLAVVNNKELELCRFAGKIAGLSEKAKENNMRGQIGIAHTRWATHGIPSVENAHPHQSGKIAIVHNGIIENYLELKEELVKEGYEFKSQTDTETVVHLIHKFTKTEKSLLEAVKKTVAKLRGSYGLAVLNADNPEEIVAVRRGSPMVLGLGFGENFIASDTFALLPVTRKFVYLKDGDFLRIERENYEIFDENGTKVDREVVESNQSSEGSEKGIYKHFMQKEMFEQPSVIAETMEGRIFNGELNKQSFSESLLNTLKNTQSIEIIACGTSYHAGLVIKYHLEAAGIKANVEYASEYLYRPVVVLPNTLFITISQSGETADTLAALEKAKKLPYLDYLTVCNVPESALVRSSNHALLTRAGREIGVASTKAFTTQLIVLHIIKLLIQELRGEKIAPEVFEALARLPSIAERMLKLNEGIAEIAEELKDKNGCLFLGRGECFAIAAEGALKLKELAYIHAEAYPSGELKHGPLALVDKNMSVVAVLKADKLGEKIMSNLQEVQARGGRLIVFADSRVNTDALNERAKIFDLGELDDLTATIAGVIPLQLFAYNVALAKGTDVDQPRNLAKSVTVE